MQVTPATWEFVETVLLGTRVPRTANGNVRVGVLFLRHLLRTFRGNERLAVGAYYQGARSVRRRGLLPETRRYVANVLALKYRRLGCGAVSPPVTPRRRPRRARARSPAACTARRVFSSATLDGLTGARVHLKAELFQRTGSFKPRGVLNKLATLTAEEKARGVISISAGNHAQALAYAAARRGHRRARRHVAHGAPAEDRGRARLRRDRGHEAPGTSPQAFERLDQLRRGDRAHARAPVRRPASSWPGRARSALEIVEDVPDVDVVLVPVGGGGLVSGIATAVKGLRPERARGRGRARAVRRAARSRWPPGKPVTVQARSIADGLNGPYAGAQLRRDLPRARRRERARHRGRDPQTRSASSTGARSSRARPPARPRRLRSWPVKRALSGDRAWSPSSRAAT